MSKADQEILEQVRGMTWIEIVCWPMHRLRKLARALQHEHGTRRMLGDVVVETASRKELLDALGLPEHDSDCGNDVPWWADRLDEPLFGGPAVARAKGRTWRDLHDNWTTPELRQLAAELGRLTRREPDLSLARAEVFKALGYGPNTSDDEVPIPLPEDDDEPETDESHKSWSYELPEPRTFADLGAEGQPLAGGMEARRSTWTDKAKRVTKKDLIEKLLMVEQERASVARTLANLRKIVKQDRKKLEAKAIDSADQKARITHLEASIQRMRQQSNEAINRVRAQHENVLAEHGDEIRKMRHVVVDKERQHVGETMQLLSDYDAMLGSFAHVKAVEKRTLDRAAGLGFEVPRMEDELDELDDDE